MYAYWNFTLQEEVGHSSEPFRELNQNTLCVYGLSKLRNTGITEYINLENSGNYKRYDLKGNICILTILLQLLPLLLPHYFIYNIEGKFELSVKSEGLRRRQPILYTE